MVPGTVLAAAAVSEGAVMGACVPVGWPRRNPAEVTSPSQENV